MAILTRASYTVLDYNDGLSFIKKISSNSPKSILLNPDNGTLSPDWETAFLVLTPTVVAIGASTVDVTADLISTKWYYRLTGGDWIELVDNSASDNTIIISNKVLTYKVTEHFSTSTPTIEFKFGYSYVDSTLGVTISDEINRKILDLAERGKMISESGEIIDIQVIE